MITVKLTEEERQIVEDCLLLHNLCNVSCYYEYKTDMCDKCKLPKKLSTIYKKLNPKVYDVI